MEEILLYFSLKYEGDFDEIYGALQQKEKDDNIKTIKMKRLSKLKVKKKMMGAVLKWSRKRKMIVLLMF